MEFKKGHKIKPKETLTNGEVIFTDGTNDVRSNQVVCEAYGYNWSRKNQKCFAFKHNSKVHTSLSNTTNRKQGADNKIERSTITTLINGNKNTTKGNNKNNLISGESNQINKQIDNAVIFGKFGQALRQGEIVIGGGEALGISQTSTIQLSGRTSDGSATNLTVQNLTTEYIEVQNNAVLGFEVKVIAICSGGSSGTVGHYKYEEIKGAVLIDNGYNTTFSQSTTTIASSGTTGSAVMADVTDPYITVKVTGTANVNIEWFASVQLTEKKLSSSTF